MDSREISEEIAAQWIDPTSEYRADLRAARIEHAVWATGRVDASLASIMEGYEFGPRDESPQKTFIDQKAAELELWIASLKKHGNNQRTDSQAQSPVQ